MDDNFGAILKAGGFRRVGEMKVWNGEVRATLDQCCPWNGGVYVWALEAADRTATAPKYVGMHTRLLKERCAQHNGGFHSRYGSGPGKRNARNIRTILEAGQGQSVGIYAKCAADPASMEDELISKFRAGWELWNRKGQRRKGRKGNEGPPRSALNDETVLTVEEAERKLAEAFGVGPEDVKIAVRF